MPNYALDTNENILEAYINEEDQDFKPATQTMKTEELDTAKFRD